MIIRQGLVNEETVSENVNKHVKLRNVGGGRLNRIQSDTRIPVIPWDREDIFRVAGICACMRRDYEKKKGQ